MAYCNCISQYATTHQEPDMLIRLLAVIARPLTAPIVDYISAEMRAGEAEMNMLLDNWNSAIDRAMASDA